MIDFLKNMAVRKDFDEDNVGLYLNLTKNRIIRQIKDMTYTMVGFSKLCYR